jgi:hypothetical protein
MPIVCIRRYLKSVSKSKFLISDTYLLATLCLREQDERNRGYLSKPQEGPRAEQQHYGSAQRYTVLNCNKICQQIWQEWAEIYTLKYSVTHCAHCHETHASMTICTRNFGTELPEDLTGFGHRHVIPCGQTLLIFPLQRIHKDLTGILITLISRLTSSHLTSFVPTPKVLSQERKFPNAMLNVSSSC